MKRRAFLTAFGLGLIAVIGVAVAGPRSLARAAKRVYLRHFGPDDDEVAAALQAQLSHLQIPTETGTAFARAYRQTRLEPLLSIPLKPEIAVRFLLSTDFVQNGGDASRALQYVQLYSPYHSSCYNPFNLVSRG